jgi:hypothetical protein
MVNGQWSMVNGQWSMTNDKGQRTNDNIEKREYKRKSTERISPGLTEN